MNRYRAFTLIELLLAIAILGILASIGIPSFSWLYEKNQTATVVNGLVQAIHHTRHYAVIKNAQVTLCGSTNQKSCSKQWVQGQILFIDYNQNGKVNSEDKILASYPALPNDSTLIKTNSFQSKSYVYARPYGMPRQNGRFVYCPPSRDPHYAQQIIISPFGRIYLAEDSDGDGIVEYPKGKPTQCSK